MRRTVKRISSFAGILAILFSTALLINCRGGNDEAPPPPAGKVVLGDVSGAVVFADHKTGSEANFKMDADEASTSTTTGANGSYTLRGYPSYSFNIVSSGGTDTLTGNEAMTMACDAGLTIVSPLTTLVLVEPTMSTVISNLGVDYKADISLGVTPAAALLVHSIQNTMSSLTRTLDDDAGGDLKNDQISTLHKTAITKIAGKLKDKTTTELTTVSSLATALRSGVKDTLDDATVQSTISLSYGEGQNSTATALQMISDALIQSVSNAIGTINTTTSVTELSLLSGEGDLTSMETATNLAIDNSTTTITCTAPENTPPAIAGTPTTSLTVGTAYSFTPTATDADGDNLTFEIQNRPDWATFNFSNGQLAGTPTAALTYVNIVISVTDGAAVVSLPAFTITVTSATGSTGGTGGTGGTGTGSGF